jgi:hypothetical protein
VGGPLREPLTILDVEAATVLGVSAGALGSPEDFAAKDCDGTPSGSSKYGVWQSEDFASREDELAVVTALTKTDDRVMELSRRLEATSSRVELVQMS